MSAIVGSLFSGTGLIENRVAALYVETGGGYFDIADVDPWDEPRDARSYGGPHPVVAHPPCERWGRFWSADGSAEPGQDGGCFASALASVRRWGGVLEHPEASHAWSAFGLPPASPGTRSQGPCGGWSTCVAQRNYGHRAIKLTWLYYFGASTPSPMDWRDPDPPSAYLSQPGRCSADRPRRRCSCRRCELHFGSAWIGRPEFERMGPRENSATPPLFRSALIEIARSSTTTRTS